MSKKDNGGISKWNKSQLKKEFETLKNELTQQLIKMSKKDNGDISKRNKTHLKKEFETLKKELTQQLIKMNKKDNGGILKWNKFFLFFFTILRFFLVFRLGGREAMNTNTMIIELITFYNSMLNEILKLPRRNCRQAVDRSFFLREATNTKKLIIRLLKSYNFLLSAWILNKLPKRFLSCVYRSKNDMVFLESGHVTALIKFRKLHRQFQTLNFLSFIKER